jgi:hypothetical protein
MSKSSRHWMLGAVGALIALPLAQAAAQTIVQNIDEPGRNPYQETVQGGFHNFAGFQVSFSVVPVNTRRVLKHVNCQVTVQATRRHRRHSVRQPCHSTGGIADIDQPQLRHFCPEHLWGKSGAVHRSREFPLYSFIMPNGKGASRPPLARAR